MIKKKSKDPHYQREKKKYATPIPSRELILQTLKEAGRPLSKQEIHDLLDISEIEQDIFGFRLKAMLRDGQLMQDRRKRLCLVEKINLLKGRVQGHPDGFGFVILDEEGDDLVLSPKEMRAVMHGDHVLAYQIGLDRRGRPEAKIREITEHANTTLVGRFQTEYGVGFVIPDNKRITQDISIPLEFSLHAQHGQMVAVELMAFPSYRNQAIAKVIEVLGDHLAPGMETQVSIRAYGIPNLFPEAVLAEVANIPMQVTPAQQQDRVDLRHLDFITIDGEDAQDFDDAVYCCPKSNGGFQLYVAIADVSYYVPIQSALDQEALNRGNSVYFPTQVIPMLPEALSNEICSLKPHVDRLCMVAELSVSATGKLMRTRFYRAIFQSKARLTYTQVAQWIEKDQVPADHQEIWPNLQSLYKLYQQLLHARMQRGALDFETTETRIIFDDQQKIKAVVPVMRNVAHRLIEECMLLANVAVARYLSKAGIAMLYRVHAGPEKEKIDALRAFLGAFGLQLSGGKKPHSKDFQKTLAIAKTRTEKNLIETVLLRSLKQARYCEENDGHFGLAYATYTHFTSPIRRYPDLLVHRALGHLIDNQLPEAFAYSVEEMSKLGKTCSITERRADEAVRDVVAWLKCEYMQDKLGQEFEGTISTVTGFGIFVLLKDIYVEGLVHITSLRNDYYAFDAIQHRLVGERSGQIYVLGQSITVAVARVDLDERKIDFEPIMD